MIRRAFVALVASVAVLPFFSGPAAAYEPGGGPVFNQPVPNGDPDKYRIAKHITRAIQGVPRRSARVPHPAIKIATYSHDLKGTTDALIAAHRRGVSVQMVINDNWTSYQTKRLIQRLGKNRNARSFVHVCKGACRGAGTRTNQHAKMFLFSRTGRARNVVMTGSANTTGFAAKVHWNDMFTAKRVPNLYDVYARVFRQMKNDDGDPNGYLPYRADGYDGYFFPKYGFTKSEDPVLHRLNAIRCDAGRGGVGGRSTIRINMYAWTGDRGLWLAKKLAELKRRGCNVRAIVSSQGALVLGELKRGGVTVKSASLDLDGNPYNGWENKGWEVFTHEKWMTLNGRYKGRLGKHVWTGSDNWSDLSNNNDEVVIHVRSERYYARYMNHFDLIWNRWSRRL
jgi:hypothetical protein